MSERTRILSELKGAQDAQAAAELARQKAILLESNLREELRKVEVEAEEAIAVEEAQILSLERHEAVPPVSDSLALAPFTWSSLDGLADEFWDPSSGTPWVVS